MPTLPKKNPKEEPTEKPAAKSNALPAGRYFQSIGRRKCSIARVRIFDSSKKREPKSEIEIIVNGKPHRSYFSLSELKEIVASPLQAVPSDDIAKIMVVARGGGIRGQAEAAQLGIARALVLKNQEFKKTLKDLGLLTRDARKVERKKAGLKKARRAPQFSKR